MSSSPDKDDGSQSHVRSDQQSQHHDNHEEGVHQPLWRRLTAPIGRWIRTTDGGNATGCGLYYGLVMGYPVGSIMAYLEARTHYEDLQMPMRRYMLILGRSCISFGLSFGWWSYMHRRLNILETRYAEPNGPRDRISHVWRGGIGGLLFSIPFASHMSPSFGSLVSYILLKTGRITVVNSKGQEPSAEGNHGNSAQRPSPYSVLTGFRKPGDGLLGFPPITRPTARALEAEVEHRLVRAIPYVLFSGMVGVLAFPTLRISSLDAPWTQLTAQDM
eukprot:gb/GECG01015456.1/.p1 GENE.gb/GECG01015456.1/~~gb/GECG01015456.1/.p1  ORF type:complete len:274 (+),score=16.95 gb/GECG01015456.1/:1-822(+)